MSQVAKRYARAMFEVASAQGVVDRVEEELFALAQTLTSSPQLEQWLVHPHVTGDQKKEVFHPVLSNMLEITGNLLFLLIDRHRESELPAIAVAYKHLADEARGTADAEVTTATPLTEEDHKRLSAVFEKIVGKTVRVTHRVDPEILGGVVVRIGDRLYDGSLKTKLHRFQRKLATT